MTTIYLVRHGEVENPEDILYMRLPGFPLSEVGRGQVRVQGERIKKETGESGGVAAIYHSPLLRTTQTAEILKKILETGKVVKEERLIDVKTPLEGKITFAEFYSEKYGSYMYHPELIEKGGETPEDIWQRMGQVVEEILGEFEGNSVVLVSHGDPIQIMKLGFQGVKFENITSEALHGGNFPQKGSVTMLRFEKKRLNEVDYWLPE